MSIHLRARNILRKRKQSLRSLLTILPAAGANSEVSKPMASKKSGSVIIIREMAVCLW